MKVQSKRCLSWLAAAGLLVPVVAVSGPAAANASVRHASASAPVTIGVDLTYDNTAFWAAYDTYEAQYAKQLNVKVLGPLLSAASASLQNQQVEELVNEGAKAVVVNPETATSMEPAIAYAAKKGVQLISTDTIVGAGHVYMVVRASNLLYGWDACAYIASKVQSGYVLDLEGDLSSSNGADRTNGFNECMAVNAPKVHILKDPTVWTDATAVTDAQDAVNAYGSQLKAIYSQWSSPDLGIIPLLKKKGFGPVGSAKHVILISDDGVAFEMCDIGTGWVDASASQPANLYAYWALQYAKDAATGVALKAGETGGGAPTLADVSYAGDTNLGDPVVAPFVTKTVEHLTIKPAGGSPSEITTTPVSDSALWGNVYGKAHGGVCSGVSF
jgi:ABC-type sugar transport system substrate-binding protein